MFFLLTGPLNCLPGDPASLGNSLLGKEPGELPLCLVPTPNPPSTPSASSSTALGPWKGRQAAERVPGRENGGLRQTAGSAA